MKYEKHCEVCGKFFVKCRSDKVIEPRFCSNPCRMIGQRKPEASKIWKVFQLSCCICGASFKRKTSKEKLEKNSKVACKSKCAAELATLNRGLVVHIDMISTCENCGNEFKYHDNPNEPKRFCGQSCVSLFFKTWSRTDDERHQLWIIKFGKEIADKKLIDLKKKRSAATIVSNTGRVLSEQTKDKIATSCTGIPNAVKGRTFIEFYGEERGIQLGKDHSEKLKAGFSSGKLTPAGLGHNKFTNGRYKGIIFRSSYEYGFMKMMEAQGYVLGIDVLYEPIHCRVPYKLDDIDHVYFPDYLIVSEQKVCEVKPKNLLKTPEVKAKLLAASSHLASLGFTFNVLQKTNFLILFLTNK